MKKHPEMSEAPKNGAYGAAVEHLDQSTGCILDALDRLSLSQHTLVIFTSDNGAADWDDRGGSNAPLRGGKGSTLEGGMREPCVMRWPSHIPADSTCGELTTAMDLLPTAAHLCDTSVPESAAIDGKDISDILTGIPGARTPYEALFYYNTDHSLYAVRSGKWKLHLIDNELYDLAADIGEVKNLYGEHLDVVARLSALADDCRRELGDAHIDIEGTGCRPVGRVENPRTITSLDDMDPIIRAMYD